MNPCVLVGDLGPNPAPLSEAVWALARHHGLHVRAAFLLTYSRGVHYLDREFLAAGGALDQLHAVLGDDVLPRAEIHQDTARGPDGARFDDDWEPSHTLAWNEARWRNAHAALKAAGSDPVVFALLGGRRRSMSALDAVVFQMLARDQDRLLDVRVSERRAEGGSGFFFPEQRTPLVGRAGEQFDARTVEVRLVDLAVPRLQRLLGKRVPATYAEALARTGAAVEQTPPMLTVDLRARKARIGDAVIPLSARQFSWYATLAWVRRDDVNGDGWISTDEVEPRLHRTLQRMKALDPDWSPTSGPLLKLASVGPAPPGPWQTVGEVEDWSNPRSTTRTRVKKFVVTLGLPSEAHKEFVPHTRAKGVGPAKGKVKLSATRLPLKPSRIDFFPPL